MRNLIPEAYRTEATDFTSNDAVLARLKAAYRQTLDQLPDTEKKTAAEKFAVLVRQESSEQVESYGDVFFLSDDLVHLGKADALIIIRYFISRLDELNSPITSEVSAMMSSLGKFVPPDEVWRFASALIKLVVRQPPEMQSPALTFVGKIYDAMDPARKELMEKRIKAMQKRAKDSSVSATLGPKLDMIESYWSDIPF